MKTKLIISLSIVIIMIIVGTVLISCNELDKTIKAAVADGKITKSEARIIDKVFDEEGISSFDDKVDYVYSLAPDLDKDYIEKVWMSIVDSPEKASKAVFVYLDNTESMRGYMNATDASKFANVLTAINDYYSKDNISPQAFYTEAITQDGKKVTNVVSVDFAQLRSDLTAHKMNKYTDSYQLNDFFCEVTKRLHNDPKQTSICFFVTDGIPSGTNEEISNSPQRKFSISQKEELQSRIAGALRPLGAKGGFGAAIFQFFAPFKGQYWKYNNDNRTILNDHERPFYVFAVGQKDMLEDFIEQVEDGLRLFEPKNTVVFMEGDEQFIPRNPEYLEKKDNKKNEFFFDAEEVNEDEEKDDAMATLYFKFDGLPYYLRDISMLKQKVSIEVENENVPTDVKIDRINFKVKAREQATQKVRVVVEDFLPLWVSTSSSPDDSSLSPDTIVELNKTFNLDIVVRGIEQGIFNKGGERYAIDELFILNSNKNDGD